MGLTRGFIKSVIGARDDRILGFTMIGPEAGEVMAVVQAAMLAGMPFTPGRPPQRGPLALVQAAMLAGMPFTGLRNAILTHPTMAEGLTILFSSVPVVADKCNCAASAARARLDKREAAGLRGVAPCTSTSTPTRG
jgi:hypothetical protein